MSITAILIPFDPALPVREVELGDTLDDIYTHVAPDSRLFEVVRSDTFDLFGDEEGLLRQDAHERINVRAMEILATDQGVGPEAFASPLVGDFLLTGHPDPGGNKTDAPHWVAGHRYTWTLNHR